MRIDKLRSAIALAGMLGIVASITSIGLSKDRENPPVEEMTTARPMDRTIIRTVARIMDQQHLSKHALDDEISERAFDQMLRAPDPSKLYLLKSDVEAF